MNGRAELSERFDKLFKNERFFYDLIRLALGLKNYSLTEFISEGISYGHGGLVR